MMRGGRPPSFADLRRRRLLFLAVLALAYATVAFQIVRVTTIPRNEPKLAPAETVRAARARPDIVDRQGRLLATDVQAPSLYADPFLIQDPDATVDTLAAHLPDLKINELRTQLADKNRRFVWIRRGLTPRLAQTIHDLGLLGLGFRYEPRRSYPAADLARHVLGRVDVDNLGRNGIEADIDQQAVPSGDSPPPVRLTIDTGVQYGLEAELADAIRRYRARAASGIVMDAATGAIRAVASLPLTSSGEGDIANKAWGGSWELGSIFKLVTMALAFEHHLATPETMLDVRQPIVLGRWTIRDPHPAGRPLSVRDAFIYSSNVGAGMLALQAGPETQRAFLEMVGVLPPMRFEAGAIEPPQIPKRWGRIETVTIGYGHGLAIAPLQFAAVAASLLNGGWQVTPTLLEEAVAENRKRIVSEETSARLRDLMRANVTSARGTGRRADVPGYEIGGKTGTAEIAGRGGYDSSAVVSSFLAAFPMSKPRYVVLMSLFEPDPTTESNGQIAAGATAAPAAGRLVARIAPLLHAQ